VTQTQTRPFLRSPWLVALAIVVGILLIALAGYYWAEPAKSLPSWLPGHQSGSPHHHFKHGLASFLVGLACLIFAWFQTGDRTRARRIRT